MRAFITAKTITETGLTLAVEYREDDGATVVKAESLSVDAGVSASLVRAQIQHRLTTLAQARTRATALSALLPIGEL